MLRKCAVCNGKKNILVQPYGIYITCDVCQGKGGFDVPDNKDLCPDCKGKGKVNKLTSIGFLVIEVNCDRCFGTGLIDKTE